MYLAPLLKESYSYDYLDEPRYGNLIFMMEKMLLDIYCIPDRYFSWFNKDYNGRPITKCDLSSAEIRQELIDQEPHALKVPKADFIRNNASNNF